MADKLVHSDMDRAAVQRFVDLGDGTAALSGTDISPWFFSGRESTTFYKFSIDTASNIVIKVVLPTDVILNMYGASLTAGSIEIEAVADGTEGGTFSTTLPVTRTNRMANSPDYEPQAVFTTDGTYTGGTVTSVIPVYTGSNVGHQVEQIVGTESPRGVPAGTYYIRIVNVGQATAVGVFRSRWAEVS